MQSLTMSRFSDDYSFGFTVHILSSCFDLTKDQVVENKKRYIQEFMFKDQFHVLKGATQTRQIAKRKQKSRLTEQYSLVAEQPVLISIINSF